MDTTTIHFLSKFNVKSPSRTDQIQMTFDIYICFPFIVVFNIILHPKMEPVPTSPSPPTSTNSTITCCYSRHCRRFIIISFCIRCTSSICNCSINGYRTKSLAMHDAMAEAIALLSFSFLVGVILFSSLSMVVLLFALPVRS